MKFTRAQFNTFLCFYAVCLFVQFAGAYYTSMGVHDWYPALRKSALMPPGQYFGIAWTALYFLMAVAATRLYTAAGTFFYRPLAWWTIQLLLGLIWSMVFFGHQSILAGMIIIACNLVAVAITMVAASETDRVSVALLAPLFAWLAFACYLNLFILQNN